MSSELLCGNNEHFTPSHESSAKHLQEEGSVGVQGASPAWAAPRGSLWRCRDVPVVHLEKLMEAAQKCSTFGFNPTGGQITGLQVGHTELWRKIAEAHGKVNSCSNPSGFYFICLRIFCLGIEIRCSYCLRRIFMLAEWLLIIQGWLGINIK